MGPSEQVERFLVDEAPPTPFVIMDLDVIRQRYLELAKALPDATVFYAVKANPSPEIVSLLARLGSSFDVASPAEIDLCIGCGADPEMISFGNTIKKEAAIALAWEKGIRLFAFDSAEELAKLVRHAPGSTAFCRILCDGAGADYPLTRKFGCDPELARVLLTDAAAADMEVGVSFHVGSQQRDPAAWDRALATVADLFAFLRARGIEPSVVNLGGGFPGRYRDDLPSVAAYGKAIGTSVRRRLGPDLPARIIAEPGRYLVADAGLLRSEVVLVTRKAPFDEQRWVYLDAGLYSGLVETIDNAICYMLRTSRDGEAGPTGPVVLAGPTCDSIDILYENVDYRLPLSLQGADHVDFLSAGAYTSATSMTPGFNGFPPVVTYFVEAESVP